MTRQEIMQEVFVAVAVASSLGFGLWRVYSTFVYGGDPADEAFAYILHNHTYAFTFAMIALLALAVWLDLRHYRRSGFFVALTPFRTIAAAVALALLVWTGLNGT